MRNKNLRNKTAEQTATRTVRVPAQGTEVVEQLLGNMAQKSQPLEQKPTKIIRVPVSKVTDHEERKPRNKPAEQIIVKVNVTVPYRKVGGEIIEVDHAWIEERFRKNEERWQAHKVKEKTYLRNIDKFNDLKKQLIEEEKKLKNNVSKK